MQRFDTFKSAVTGAAAAVMIAGGVGMAFGRDVAIPTPAGTFAPLGDSEQSAPAEPTEPDTEATPDGEQGGGPRRTFVALVNQADGPAPAGLSPAHYPQQDGREPAGQPTNGARSTPAPVATPTVSEQATPYPHTPAPSATSTPTPVSTPGADESALPTPTPTPTEPPLVELMPWEPSGDPAVRKPVRLDLCTIMDCKPTPNPGPDIQYDPELVKPLPAKTATPGVQLDRGMTKPFGPLATPTPD